MSHRWLVSLLAALALIVSVDPAAAQRRGDKPPARVEQSRDDIVELGRTKVDFGRGGDRDVIRVGEAEGTFQSIFLEVREGDIYLEGIEIVYGSGRSERLAIGRILRSGERTQPLDLRGERRFIKELVLQYRAKPGERRRPQVAVYGNRPPLRIGDRIGDFEVIGVARTDGGSDSIRLRLDREDGRIGQLKLRSVDGRLFVRSIDLTLGNGARQSADINQRLEEGQETGVIDLQGFYRQVREITINTRERRRGGGARLAILAKEAPPLTDIPRNWMQFGSASVGLAVDRDIIRVGRAEGRFKTIALRVTKNDILLREVKVVYENGQADSQQMWLYLPANSRTMPIPLKGDRFIREIQMVYQSRPDRRGQQAQVDVFGEYSDSWMRDNAAVYELPRDWVSFGKLGVDFGRDRDVIRVGESAGRFNKLALVARDNDVYISGITIVYGNGAADKREIHRYLVSNSRTPAIELDGKRYIKEIQLDYQSRFNWRGRRGTVEVLGEQVREERRFGRSIRGDRESRGWDLLGTQRAAMLAKDSDVFRVGERAGRFTSLRVGVRGGDVRFYGLRIVYGNGTSEYVSLSGELRDGDVSQPFDLQGRERFIDYIELRYRGRLGLKRPPEIDIWGKR